MQHTELLFRQKLKRRYGKPYNTKLDHLAEIMIRVSLYISKESVTENGGPGIVIRQGGKVVIVRYGNSSLRVHLPRVTEVRNTQDVGK